MHRFYNDIVKPCLEAIGARYVVEVGCDFGDNTINLLHYAEDKGGVLYGIDPYPSFPSEQWEAESKGHFVMFKDLSLNVLPKIDKADAILIDGDHNWYTVYNELMCIKEKFKGNFPLIMFHDVSWPYDRRDLYYNPDTIPSIYRHEYKKGGIRPDSRKLTSVGEGINAHLLNACEYGGNKNGVKTAIDDFIKNSPELNAEYFEISVINGLGMLAVPNRHRKAIKVFNSLDSYKSAVNAAEKDRIRYQLASVKKDADCVKYKNGRRILVKIYADFGSGFSEENVITKEYLSENINESISFETAPLRLRIDPAAGSCCIVGDLVIASGKGIIRDYSVNGSRFDNAENLIIFENTNPQIVFDCKGAKRFDISMNVVAFKSTSAFNLLKYFKDSVKGLKEAEEKNSKITEEYENKLKEAEKEALKLTNINYSLMKTEAKNKLAAKRLLSLNKPVGFGFALKTALRLGVRPALMNLKGLKAIRANGGFDPLKYLRENEDIQNSKIDPLVHYIWFGGYEGRSPCDEFNSAEYLKAYEDVRNSRVNPYVHYMLFGSAEKRKSFGLKKGETASDGMIGQGLGGFFDGTDFNSLGGSVSEIYDEFYNFSALTQKLYPQNSYKDKMLSTFMDAKAQTLSDIYGSLPQDIKVSVIMPSFNREKVISKAIESVIEQSYKNWDLIIADDNSTDNTESVVSEYCKVDSRIKYFKNTRKKGVSGARNTGLEKASGDYIAYLDTDDDWDKDYLLIMVNTLKNNSGFNAIYCAQNIYKYEEGTKEPVFQYIRFGAYNISVIKNTNYVDLNCYMHKSELYKEKGGFNEELMRFVDWELILRYSKFSYPFALNVRLSNYYFDRADKQITSKTIEGYAEKLKAFDEAVTGDCLNLQSERLLDISGYKFYNDKITPYETESRRAAIVIPSYEALHCLVACLEAVKKYTAQFDYEIIIVDNNSSQPVKDYLNKLAENEKSVKVILNNYNMGFTYAVNQGIKAARENSDIILLNNDAVVTEGWLNELYRVKDNIKDAGLIVPRQVLLPETKTMHAHVPMGILSRELDVNVSVHHHNVLDLKKYYRQGFIKLTFAPFFLVMITKECYEKLGLLDEENGRHYKSDRLYCQKAAENGIEVVYTPYSKAYHLLQQSTQVLKESDKAMYETIFNNNDWSDIGCENSDKAAQSVTQEGKTQ